MAATKHEKSGAPFSWGEREASVEQFDAMQEPLRRDKIRKEQTEDYMERVRNALPTARGKSFGAAYTERLKVLDEARADAEAKQDRRGPRVPEAEKRSGGPEKEAAEELKSPPHSRGSRANSRRRPAPRASGTEWTRPPANCGSSAPNWATPARVLQSLPTSAKTWWMPGAANFVTCACSGQLPPGPVTRSGKNTRISSIPLSSRPCTS